MTDQPHWAWLMGPATNPDPRVGDMSASCHASRQPETVPRVPWDEWLNEQIRQYADRATQPEQGAA